MLDGLKALGYLVAGTIITVLIIGLIVTVGAVMASMGVVLLIIAVIVVVAAVLKDAWEG